MCSSIFVTGEAKAPSNNPITSRFGLFYVALVVDTNTHRILDAECSATLALTNSFVKSLIVGASVLEEGQLAESISARYLGSSQRALVTALHNASAKYRHAVGRGELTGKH